MGGKGGDEGKNKEKAKIRKVSGSVTTNCRSGALFAKLSGSAVDLLQCTRQSMHGCKKFHAGPNPTFPLGIFQPLRATPFSPPTAAPPASRNEGVARLACACGLMRKRAPSGVVWFLFCVAHSCWFPRLQHDSPKCLGTPIPGSLCLSVSSL